MEPHREEQKAPPPSAKPKPKRFRIIKLEERIAPAKGGGGKPTREWSCATECGCGLHSHAGDYCW